jgi:hypothetical protein
MIYGYRGRSIVTGDAIRLNPSERHALGVAISLALLTHFFGGEFKFFTARRIWGRTWCVTFGYSLTRWKDESRHRLAEP